MEVHLDGDELARLLVFDGAREEIHELLVHLAVCRECRRRLVAAYPLEGSTFLRKRFPNLSRDTGGGFAQVWEETWTGPERPSEIWARENSQAMDQLRHLALRLAREHHEAREQWAELSSLTPAQRRLKVFNSCRLRTLGMVGVVLEHAREAWTSQPEEAESLAELALEILGGLDPKAYDVMVLEDYRARGLAYLGNARRVLSNLAGAEQALEAARAALELGTGDVLERAKVSELESSLRRAQRRFEEAMDLAADAAELYRSIGDQKQEAWMWVAQAFIAGEAGRTDEAIRVLEAFLRCHTRMEVGDRIYFAALQGLGHRLVEAGRPEEARRYLPEIRRLVDLVAEPLLSLRVSWLEGLIYDGLGQVEAAARAYRSVRDTFIERGIGYDAALVSLDLALLYLRQGKVAEARQLAVEMLPIFQSRGIHREALGALSIFQQALAQEAASVALGREVVDYLERSRRAPELPFRPARG